jgi:hypothetical protein
LWLALFGDVYATLDHVVFEWLNSGCRRDCQCSQPRIERLLSKIYLVQGVPREGDNLLLCLNPAAFDLSYLTERTQQMPPPFELSLCHLPDMSNASFSFQIPTALTKGDLLLGDDDVDFFRNVDDTPGSSRTTHTPLTLADLTPKASVEIVSGTGVPTPPAFDQQYNPKSKKLPPQGIKRVAHGPPTTKADSRSNKKVTRARAGEASPAVARLRALRTEVEMLNEDLRSGVDDVVSSNSTVGEARDRTQGSKLPKAIANRKHVRSQRIHPRKVSNITYRPSSPEE